MKKELPLKEPLKMSHQFYAHPFSIIMNDEDRINWFYSEFLQMFTYRQDDETPCLMLYNYGNVDEYDPLEFVRITTFPLRFGDDLIKLFKLYIDNEYYPYVICDDSYISSMDIKVHRAHDLLLYGYDDDEKSFLVFAYNGPKMTKFFVSYDEMVMAYYAKEISHIHRSTLFYKRKEKKYRLDMEKIKWHLLDYVQSVDTLRREKPHVIHRYKDVWGMDIYDEMKYKIILAKENGQESIIPACFYLIYEHKRDMIGRLKYLEQNSQIKFNDEIMGDFEKIMRDSMFLLNLNIKINNKKLKNCERDIENIFFTIDKMRAEEKDAIEKYFSYNHKEFLKI